MKITIKRFHKEREPQSIEMDFEAEIENVTLLEFLTHIKRVKDPSLTFSSGCRSSICGSCSMRVNGVEQLACAYKVQDGDFIEPLRYMEVLKDLVVDFSVIEEKNRQVKAWAQSQVSETMLREDEKLIETQTDCILCASCFSACPVMAVNPAFAGPFALTRAWRYTADSREDENKEIMEAIQPDGIWDCTLCNECVPVCPQGIAPKQDISMLQAKAGTLGFMNPKFSGGMDFGTPMF